MSTLLRAPRECASWAWDLDEYAAPGLESALTTAERMSAVLREHDLLEASALEWGWFIPSLGGMAATTRIPVQGPLDDPKLPLRLRSMRPVDFVEAEPGDILLSGSGIWFDADGKPRHEHRLVELTVSPEPLGLSAEVAVFHDIWGRFDFRGLPHPEVHQRNAPRLAAALQALDALLGVAAEPGEPTYFGTADGYGIKTPDVIGGRGPDLTDLL
ncbi:hypothetical protein [Streptomyces sp. LN785]|uniref:hypothetical protein n=1 Tax=Streptomyces sp. LN785 TaxID=3112983 RepID=UPI00371BCF91